MGILYKILDWAESRGADVMLQCQWLGVAWNSFPEFAGDPALEIYSAPANLDWFAEGWMALLHELVRNRRYSCIKWVNLINEPGYNWWHLPTTIARRGARELVAEQMKYLAEAQRRVKAALLAAGLTVKIMGPDETDPPAYSLLSDQPWYEHVDDIDFHSYWALFDYEDPNQIGGYRMRDRIEGTYQDWAKQVHGDGKGLWITEEGTMCYGFGGSDPTPGSFRASLKDAEFLIRSMNAGVDGFSHWSFVNRADVDGQWQFIDTWDRAQKQWLPEALPHESSFRVLGLAMRYLPKGAIVHAFDLTGGMLSGIQRVWAAAVESPKDNSRTILIVNDSDQSWALALAPGFLKERLWSIESTAVDGKTWLEKPTQLSSTERINLKPLSIAIFTDSPLMPEEPGRF